MKDNVRKLIVCEVSTRVCQTRQAFFNGYCDKLESVSHGRHGDKNENHEDKFIKKGTVR